MAKIYMVDDTKKNRGAAALNTLLYPQVAAPLDTREVFYSLEDFKAYVRQDKNYAPAGYDAADIQFLKDIAPYSYAGQVVAVVSGDVTTLYKIDKVGGDVEGVNYSAIGGDVAADLGALTGRVGTLETTVSAIPSTYQTQAIPSIEGYASASLTVEGALAEVMSKAMSNAGGITAVEGRVATAEGKISTVEGKVNTLEGKVSTIERDYATTSALNSAIEGVNSTIGGVVEGLSVYETIANVNSKLANYYTKEQADEKHEEVVEIAQGKTQTFVVNYADNAFLNSQDAELNAQQFITIDGKAIGPDVLKAGDVILVVETDVPDRWVKQVNEQGDFVLAKLETTKVDLEPYATTNYVDTTLKGYATISYVDQKDNEIKENIQTIEGDIQAIEAWAASSISVEDIEKWNKAEENAHNSAVTSASAMVAEEAGVRESADNALSARIDAEVEARINGDNALSGRLDDIQSDYAKGSYVDDEISKVAAEISKVAAAATKVEKSDTNGNILVDGEEVVVYNDEALAERVTNAEASIATNAEAIASNAEHFTELQGTVASIDTRVTNLETTVEGIPSIYATKEELSTEANTRAEEDGKLATRLSLVEESLGLRDPEDPEGGDNKGIAEQIATIVAEIWGSQDMSVSSRIDKLEMADTSIGQRIDGVVSRLDANLLSTVSGGSYVSASISGNNLTIDDSNLVGAISSIDDRLVALESNAVLDVLGTDNLLASISNNQLNLSVSVSVIASQLVDGYASILANGIAPELPSDIIKEHVFGTSSIASNAVYLVSKDAKVSVLNELADNLSVSAYEINTAATWVSYNMGVVSNLASNAVTSVQTSTLVMSHSSNYLMINLPSVIWLDGGSASDTYEAEEAVYNELLNNEYGN